MKLRSLSSIVGLALAGLATGCSYTHVATRQAKVILPGKTILPVKAIVPAKAARMVGNRPNGELLWEHYRIANEPQLGAAYRSAVWTRIGGSLGDEGCLGIGCRVRPG